MAFFEDSDINLMQWPGQSPDLNPIEHLWDELERCIRQQDPPPTSEKKLAEILQEEWKKIPNTIFQNLIFKHET